MNSNLIFLEIAAIAVAVAASSAGVHYLVQRHFDPELLSEQNDVAGLVYSAIAVTYAVVLGFVVIVAWQNYGQIQNYVDAEPAAVFDLDHIVTAFPQPVRKEIRAQLLAYAQDVVIREWPEMRKGVVALSGAADLEALAHRVETFEPVGAAQQDAHLVALQQLIRVFDARRQRVLALNPSIPGTLWFAVIAGALATLGFTFFFGAKSRIAQLLMTGVLAAVIAVMFVAIREFDEPFRGPNAIAPNGWYYFESRMKALGAGD